jgi:N-acetyl-anhydromuramyl-L-alanine amidase AmpD
MNIISLPSPNYWVDNSPIVAICLHGSGGDKIGGIQWLRSKKSGVSSNFFISKDSETAKLVDPFIGRRAWGNGIVNTPDPSIKWLGAAIKNKVNPNLITISVEHEATSDDMKFHRAMTDGQFNSSIELVAALLRQCGLKATHETIVAHCQINSVDKATCPGVIFVPAYLEVLLQRHPDLKG